MGLGGILLFPFTLLYNLATRLRNHLFNIGYTRSFQFEVKVICVGNLSVGGTGKTPMLEYLIYFLKDQFQIATLSRGYGRKTKGFRIADQEDDAKTIGDEPYQFFLRHGQNITVAVGEERALAIPEILFHKPDINLILLDDAYQHRTVVPNVNILLTEFSKPFFKDYVLPSGRLRESRGGAKRAHAIVVTKCPIDLSDDLRSLYIKSITKYAGDKTPVFFSTIDYFEPVRVFSSEIYNKYIDKQDKTLKVLLVSGIANPKPLATHIESSYTLHKFLKYNDHHAFSTADVEKILEEFQKIEGKKKVIIVTEKDMVKFLQPNLKNLLEMQPFYFLPIRTKIIADEDKFLELISKSIF